MKKIFSKYIPFFFIFFSILLLIYTIYRSEYFYQGSKTYYYKTYYLISIIFLFFSIANFFLKEELKIKISIIILSVIFSLYLVEGLLLIPVIEKKFTTSENQYTLEFAKKYDNYDGRSLLEAYKDMKIKDENIVLAFQSLDAYKEQKLFQLSGISNKKTILCNESGYFAIYHSDRYGFNNPDNEWDKKQIDFFLVGDSFVHGHCVNEPDTIGGNLRNFKDMLRTF